MCTLLDTLIYPIFLSAILHKALNLLRTFRARSHSSTNCWSFACINAILKPCIRLIFPYCRKWHQLTISAGCSVKDVHRSTILTSHFSECLFLDQSPNQNWDPFFCRHFDISSCLPVNETSECFYVNTTECLEQVYQSLGNPELARCPQLYNTSCIQVIHFLWPLHSRKMKLDRIVDLLGIPLSSSSVTERVMKKKK